MSGSKQAEDLRKLAFDLSCHDQFWLASIIAENVGYTLTPDRARYDEDERMSDARNGLLKEIDDIFDNAKQISCTRLSLAIEILVDARIKELSAKS